MTPIISGARRFSFMAPPAPQIHSLCPPGGLHPPLVPGWVWPGGGGHLRSEAEDRGWTFPPAVHCCRAGLSLCDHRPCQEAPHGCRRPPTAAAPTNSHWKHHVLFLFLQPRGGWQLPGAASLCPRLCKQSLWSHPLFGPPGVNSVFRWDPD